MASYVPRPLPARVICHTAAMNHGFKFSGNAWKHLSPQIEVIPVDGAHATCVTTEIADLTARLRDDLASPPSCVSPA